MLSLSISILLGAKLQQFKSIKILTMSRDQRFAITQGMSSLSIWNVKRRKALASISLIKVDALYDLQ